jgi:hypothetical protein
MAGDSLIENAFVYNQIRLYRKTSERRVFGVSAFLRKGMNRMANYCVATRTGYFMRQSAWD